jgi:hypothetical protein
VRVPGRAPVIRAHPGRRADDRVGLVREGAEVERYQEIAGITDLVDAVTTKDDAEHSKPCPDILEAALARIAPITADEAIVVGDSPFDAEAARKAGLRTVGLLCGGFSETVLREAGCVEIYRDPEDLLANYERSTLGGGRGLGKAGAGWRRLAKPDGHRPPGLSSSHFRSSAPPCRRKLFRSQRPAAPIR